MNYYIFQEQQLQANVWTSCRDSCLSTTRTPMMACTATPSKSVKKEVIDCLEMSGCVEITASPDHPNIYYEVKPRTTIDADILYIITTLTEKSIRAPQVLVYCHSLDTCADLYAHFHYVLGEASYYPPGSPHLNRLFGMYHANTPQHNKDTIFKSLLVPDAECKITGGHRSISQD